MENGYDREDLHQMWPKPIVRVLALANVVFVLIGAFDSQIALSGFPILEKTIASSSVPSDFPYRTTVFYVMIAVNAAFLFALLVCSYQLWFLRPLGRRLSNVVFVSEIGYWLSRHAIKYGLLEWGGEKAQLLRNSIAAVNALGNSGLSAQFEVGYPLVALVILNVAYTRLHGAHPDIAQAKREEIGSN